MAFEGEIKAPDTSATTLGFVHFPTHEPGPANLDLWDLRPEHSDGPLARQRPDDAGSATNRLVRGIESFFALRSANANFGKLLVHQTLVKVE